MGGQMGTSAGPLPGPSPAREGEGDETVPKVFSPLQGEG
jgi:hypothetical protein